MSLPLSQIKRRPVAEVVGDLRASSHNASAEAGHVLLTQASEYGVTLRDYLTLAIDVRGSENPEQYQDGAGLLNGYEAALLSLGLPVNDNFEQGITLDLASDTFQTFPGTRALFPEVVDDLVQWNYRQNLLENTGALVGISRTVSGTQMITTVVDDDQGNYQTVRQVAELGRIPVKTIRTTEHGVTFYKHGGGYRTSYEFSRRARLDLLTPYANRMARETEMSKVGHATQLLVNGDAVHGAAPVVDQSSYDAQVGEAATDGKISFKHLLMWLVERAKAGTPVDTVVGNWNAYIQWLFMFALPTSDKTVTDADQLARTGFQIGGVPILSGVVNFALSSTMPDGQLMGYSKADTLEEMIEAGSLINESERAIQNQSITYVKTENSGYRLVFGDTRSIFDFSE